MKTIESSLGKSIALSIFAQIGLGYFVFLVAHLLRNQVSDVCLVMEGLCRVGGVVQAQFVASRLGESASPAQIMVLYGIVSSICFCMYFSQLFWLNREKILRAMMEYYKKDRGLRHPGPFRLKLSALMSFSLGPIVFLWLFFDFSGVEINWRDVAFHSSGFWSATFMIWAVLVASLSIPLAILLYLVSRKR